MLTAILDDSSGGQRLVATESIPADWHPPADCKVHTFHKKRRVLRKEEYREGIAALSDMVAAMKSALLHSDATDDEALEPTESSEPDDDDEEENGADA
jgi:hypothetical protein